MHTSKSQIARWGRTGHTLITLLSVGTLSAIVVLMVIDVLGRKFLDRPLFGAVEMVEQFLLISVYSSIPLVSRVRGHIHIEFFDALVPKAQQAWRAALGEWICAILILGCAYLVGQHALETRINGDTTTLLRIPLWPLEILVALLLLADAVSHILVSSDFQGTVQ